MFNSNKLPYITVGLVVTFVLGLAFWFLFVGGTLVVDVSKASNPANTLLFINGERQYNINEKSGTYTINGLVGSQEIRVSQPGYKDFTTSESFLLKDEKVVLVTFEEQPADEVVTPLDTGYPIDNEEAFDIKYHDNKTWLTYRIPSEFEDTEPILIVVRYDKQIGEWVVFNYGFDSEFYTPSDNFDIPGSVIEEIVG